MHPNEALIRRFYERFQARDPAGMKACYHPEVEFWDPAFGELNGEEAGAMWAMLLARATDLEVVCQEAHADAEAGSARWQATYTFTQTGRRVVNRIRAEFDFRDGLIVRHVDRFPFWRWARQALGATGLLLGWTPFLRGRVRDNALRGLSSFMAKR
jgi:ketosteroid isomerase-like protein